ncbi:ABC transporter ATP-binding protein [Streptomyces celluloflavus]|uniref:ABC transporter ATP-binding protein n=1 Tax=Streptomyces celluloflavus TaxID=58344 RepID=UPI003460888F|nr:ABC transporter ATP-binding protein/permease [Streptomyces celluloflavus]
MLITLLRVRLRPYARTVALLLLLQLVQILAALALPTLGAALIDDGVVKGEADSVRRTGAVMLAVALVQVCCSLAAALLASRTAMALGRDVRSAVFRRVLDFAAHDVGRFGTPSLLTRTVNDVQQVQMLVVSAFGVVVPAPLMCVGSLVLALRQDVPLSLCLVALVVVLAAVFGVLLSRMSPWYALMQTRLDGLGRVLREQITGVRVVRAFVQDTRERERFGELNSELNGISLRVGRQIATMFPVVLLVLNVFGVAVVWFGAGRIGSGAMQVGALSAFLGYLSLILMSVVMVTFVFLSVPRARVSAGRIQEVLGTAPSIPPPVSGARPDTGTGLELSAAEFRYPGAQEPVLRDIDLTVRPGEQVAILGSTGSGKTTLLNLVLRQFDVTAGAVRLGGTDVREWDTEVLFRTVGFVPQRSQLFSGTIASNLRFGNPAATDEELWRALETVQARDFVERLPDGLGASVAQGGTNLSGGQRQRLAIARTLLRRPRIYLFDDCFSALDYATDAALRAALAPELADATVVTVAQRVAAVRHADRIVVLDEGRIVGHGTHDALLRDCPAYQEIARSQLSPPTQPVQPAGPSPVHRFSAEEAADALAEQP